MGVKFSDSVKMGVGLAAGFFVFMLAIAFVFGGLGFSMLGEGGGSQNQTAPTQPGALPLKIFVSDGISGGGVGGTLYVLDPSTYNVIEAVTIASDGTGTTVHYFSERVLLFFTATGYASKPLDFDPDDAQIISVGDQEYYSVTIYAYPEPSEAGFTMLAFDETGAVLADESTGQTYDMTGTQTDITIQLTVPAGYGLLNYFDPTEGDNGEEDDLVLVIAINSTLATLSEGNRVEVGDTVYYIVTVGDMIASKTDAYVLRKTLTLYYGGTGVLSVSVSFYNNVDPSIIASSLTADSDTTLSDALATFYIA